MVDETKLWAHQRDLVERRWRDEALALHWPPRLGKSRAMVATVDRMREACLVNGAVVIAPNGIHLNWAYREIPASSHPARVIVWRSSRARAVRKELKSLARDEFVWFCVNVESFSSSSSEAFRAVERLARDRRCVLVLDESHKIKNPKAARTRRILAIAPLFPYRRILSGTPVAQGPFDLWAQYAVLDRSILGRSFYAFRSRYGKFRRVRYGAGPAFDELVEYQRLDELRDRIAPWTDVRRREDCLDLPDRLMMRSYYEMPPAHRRAYEGLRRDLIYRLENGEELTVANALTLLLRLQQLSRGYVTQEGRTIDLGPPYPAVEQTVDLVRSNLPGKTVVWCRFSRDVEAVCRALGEEGIGFARCDGQTPPAERFELVTRFADDDSISAWVGTLATGGEGIDLGAADQMIFYSHSFDLVQRVQGLDRNFGSSQKAPRVGVIDLVAEGSVDARVLDVLERKTSLARFLSKSGGLLELIKED